MSEPQECGGATQEDDDDGYFFDPDMFVPKDYANVTFDFGDTSCLVKCSKCSSTDHDLTGQIIWPAAIYLGWFIAQMRHLFEGKSVVEVGAGCGLSGLVASKFCTNIAITDGNEHVLELIHGSVELRLDEVKTESCAGNLEQLVGAELIWGCEKSFNSFRESFKHSVDVVIGADVVCWPQLLGRLLQTVKALLQTSPVITAMVEDETGETSGEEHMPKFFCGYVCRAMDTETELLEKAEQQGFAVKDIERTSFMTSLPENLNTQYDLRLLEFTLKREFATKAVEWSGETESSSAY